MTKTTAHWDYRDWIASQLPTVTDAMREYGRGGIMDVSLYAMPSNGDEPGYLVPHVTGFEPPAGSELVKFNRGHNIMSLAYSDMASHLYDACRELPIVPTA